MISKTCCIVAIAIGALSSVHLYPQQKDALSTLLTARGLTYIPNSYSYYKPGSLVVLKPGSIPDLVDPRSDVQEMEVQLVTGMIPTVDITTEGELSIAATLFGFSPSVKFAKTSNLHADAMTLSGWRLTTDELDTIIKKDSPTYSRAQSLYSRDHINIANALTNRNWSVYLIDAIFTSTSANISTSDGTNLTFSGGTLPACPDAVSLSETSKNKQTNQSTTSSTKPTDTSVPTTSPNPPTQQGRSTQTDTPASNKPKSDQETSKPKSDGNAVAADITAIGNTGVGIAQAVTGSTTSKATTAASTASKVKDLAPVTLPAIAFCRSSASTVSFSSSTPVPIAMILKQVTFNVDGAMALTAVSIAWPSVH